MRRTAAILATLVFVAACNSTLQGTTTTAEEGATTTVKLTTTSGATTAFPATVEADNGPVTIESRPAAIISLSSVATEMLFEIGAGAQVIAVDDQSNYPAEAPSTDLSGFTPNLEAILGLEPDLVVISFDPGELILGLETAGVPVLSFGAAVTLDDVYRQVLALGAATGNLADAIETNDLIETGVLEAVASSAGTGEGVTYYHEIDALLYTATSATFFGEIYALFGMINIADPADEDGSAFGYPQLSSEFVVTADPDIIFLANVLYGENQETVSGRPGWDAMTAVQQGDIVELDSDVASRWGPRIVEFAQAIADALRRYHGG